MAPHSVIVELAPTRKLERFAAEVRLGEEHGFDAKLAPKLEALQLDPDFAPVMLPGVRVGPPPAGELYDTNAGIEIDTSPEACTYLARAVIEDDPAAVAEAAAKTRGVVGVYADVAIQPSLVCPGSAPVGDDGDVERLLCVETLQQRGMTGRGVLVAVVDTGVNVAYLQGRGKTPTFDAARSWSWNPAQVTPGSAPVDHGSMVAYDVAIAAPEYTLLDIALLHPVSAAPGGSIMQSLLSDAIRAYRHLLDVMAAPRRAGELRSLVVNNSWGMFHPSWDFPVGHPGNYSDNPNHPFHRITLALERAGADILFAAGNCGADCPDGRCQGVTDRAIYGVNSSPAVTCVAGVDTNRARVGYSSIGPGRLDARKPDVSGYTHFRGSGVYPADGGTSAACPVVAGVVAAARSRRPFDPSESASRPAAIRNLLIASADDLGVSGYDFVFGHGVVNGCRLADRIAPPPGPGDDLCRRFPWLCDLRWLELCRRHPSLCRLLLRLLGGSSAAAGSEATLGEGFLGDAADRGDLVPAAAALERLLAADGPTSEPSEAQTAYLIGLLLGLVTAEGEERDADCI